jgi:predicted RNase H-like HicB family nuclease
VEIQRLTQRYNSVVREFTAYVEFDPATRLYVGVVPGIPGAHTQAATLAELRTNLKEVLELCLEGFEGSLDDIPRLVGIEHVAVSV